MSDSSQYEEAVMRLVQKRTGESRLLQFLSEYWSPAGRYVCGEGTCDYDVPATWTIFYRCDPVQSFVLQYDFYVDEGDWRDLLSEIMEAWDDK